MLKENVVEIYYDSFKIRYEFSSATGEQDNLFSNIINPNPEDNEHTNKPAIISYSSYITMTIWYQL